MHPATNRQFRNILIVRTDRIGDVVLSLPMVDVLRENFPEARVSILVRSYTNEVAGLQKGLHEILLYDLRGIPKPLAAVKSDLRSRRFDAVVVASPTFRLALLMFLARIPVRVGTGYRWYSFLFNNRVYEHRKTAEKHELEYNLSLLRALGCRVPDSPRLRLSIDDSLLTRAKEVQRELGLKSRGYVVLHPGSGGSARDWSAENFARLATRLIEGGWRVVVTGGPGEENLVRTVVTAAGGRALAAVNRFTLGELTAFLASAAVVVANSTGPLHLAAAVGTPVVGFYPPIRACSPQRWGPYTRRKRIFVPDPSACRRCRGGACRASDCMDQITVEDALRAVEEMATEEATTETVKVAS